MHPTGFHPKLGCPVIQMAVLHSQVPPQRLSKAVKALYLLLFSLIAASETLPVYNGSYLWHISQVKGWAGLCNQAQHQFLPDG